MILGVGITRILGLSGKNAWLGSNKLADHKYCSGNDFMIAPGIEQPAIKHKSPFATDIPS